MLKQEVKNLIEVRLQDKEISQNELAKTLNISGATMSKILNGKWDDIKEGMFLSIKSQLKPNHWNLVNTRNLQDVFTICDHARNEKMFVSVIGEEGLGKTEALTAYYKQSPNTYFITCDKGMNPKQLFSALCKEMGLPNQMPVYELKRQIISAINKQKNPLIIIDEISKVGLPNLTHFQDLWDGISNNGGLVISGAPHFFDRFLKSVNGKKIGMPELYSRIAYHHSLKKPSRNEIEAICEANGITDRETIAKAKIASNFRVLSHFIKNTKTGLI